MGRKPETPGRTMTAMNAKNSPFLTRLDAVAAETEALLDRLLAAGARGGRNQPPGAADRGHALFQPRRR